MEEPLPWLVECDSFCLWFLASGSFWAHCNKKKNKKSVTLTLSCATKKSPERSRKAEAHHSTEDEDKQRGPSLDFNTTLIMHETINAGLCRTTNKPNTRSVLHWPNYSASTWRLLRSVSLEWHNALTKRRCAAWAAAITVALSSNRPIHCFHIVPEGLLPLMKEYHITDLWADPHPFVCQPLHDLIIHWSLCNIISCNVQWIFL